MECGAGGNRCERLPFRVGELYPEDALSSLATPDAAIFGARIILYFHGGQLSS